MNSPNQLSVFSETTVNTSSKALCRGYLTAAVTASIGLVIFLTVGSASNPHNLSEIISMAAILSLCAFVVVAFAWVIVAVPYYLIAIRGGLIKSWALHLIASSTLAILFVLICSGFDRSLISDPAALVITCSIPVLSAITGTLTLLWFEKKISAEPDL